MEDVADDTAGVPFETLSIAVTIGTYAAIILVMWLPFTMMSGFPGETAFAYLSETSSAWQGFFYHVDPLRIYTSVFYHLSYLLGKTVGVQGSFVPYQVVHALLWFGRGLLVFLILRKFMPRHLLFCYLAGFLVLVHACDGALQWVGQMNQFGFIFWMLLGFYVLLIALESRRWFAFVPLTLAACWCARMSLWSYEAQLFLILFAPVTLWFFRRAYIKPSILASLIWYTVPARYIAETIRRYRNLEGVTYQESVLNKSMAASRIFSDWLFNVGQSLKFWDWIRTTPIYLPRSQLHWLSALGVLGFLTGAAGIIVIRKRQEWVNRSPAKPLWWALGTGIVVLFLSFPVYLLLNTSRGLWRTQLLSGIGAGITLSAIICLACRYCPARAVRIPISLLCGAVVGYFGISTAIVLGAFERTIWERHRSAVAQILGAAPHVKPGTMIIYTGVPKSPDPLGHDMWFDMAVRLSYPQTAVTGIYFYDDGSAAPGNNFKLEGDHWKLDGTGIEALVKDAPASHVLVLEHQAQGPARILPQLPAILHAGENAQRAYAPAGVLDGARPSPLAVRRYGPIPH